MNLIYTACAKTDERPYFHLGVDSIKRYAHRIGVDLHIKYNNDYELPSYNKYFIPELLKVYDRVMWIDADILIKESAPDLFKGYSDGNKLYIHDECEREQIDYNKYISYIIENNSISWRKNKYDKYIQYNCGVFIISRGHEKIFDHNDIKTEGFPYLIDQTNMNYNIQKLNIPIGKLDIKYNAMNYFDEPGEFIHFANVSDRANKMREFIHG